MTATAVGFASSASSCATFGDETLRELNLVSEIGDGRAARCDIRAFEALGCRSPTDGVRAGDYVIVDTTKSIRPDSLVVVDVAGQFRIARVQRNLGETVDLTLANAETLPFVVPAHRKAVTGVLVAIIGKRGFNCVRTRRQRLRDGVSAAAAEADAVPHTRTRSAPPSRVTILRGKLGMLEVTRATTNNARLQRALQREAARIRRLLQNETRVSGLHG